MEPASSVESRTMRQRYLLAACCACVLAGSLATPRVGAQQVLRGGAHLVQVDAYPLRDGQPIRGLTAADLELFEDGKPQQIDSIRFLEFPIWTPETVRQDPTTQRESFERAADPSNRLFVVYLNRAHWISGNRVEPALFDFLDRSMGARDYVGIMTAMQGPGDLVFGQLTTAFKSEISRFLNITDHMDPRYMDPAELELLTCFPHDQEGERLIARRRTDDVYRDLEGIVSLLGSLRETRSTLIFVSEQMIDPSRIPALTQTSPTQRQILPPAQSLPPARGRGSLPMPGRMIEVSRCEDLRKATLEPWSAERFKELVAQARAANVAVNSINPRGLFAGVPGAVAVETAKDELMRIMANETGGVAMVTTNDMVDAFRRIAGELTSHYLLGYYSTNRNADGRLRRITVKLKASGETIRARREYRAPRAEEVAPPAAPATASAAARPAVPDALQKALSALEGLERDSGASGGT